MSKINKKQAKMQIAEHFKQLAEQQKCKKTKKFEDFLDGEPENRIGLVINGGAVETYWVTSLIESLQKKYSNKTLYVICPVNFHSLFFGQNLKLIPFFPAAENHIEMKKFFAEHFTPQSLAKTNNFQ